MKNAFIMPVVLILMSMLLAFSMVLSNFTESQTSSLAKQNDFYFTKDIEVRLVEGNNSGGGTDCDAHINIVSGGAGLALSGSINGGDYVVNNDAEKLNDIYDSGDTRLTSGTHKLSPGDYWGGHGFYLSGLTTRGEGTINIYIKGALNITGDIIASDDIEINIYAADRTWGGSIGISAVERVDANLYAEKQIAVSGGHNLTINGSLTSEQIAVSSHITIDLPGECDDDDNCW